MVRAIGIEFNNLYWRDSMVKEQSHVRVVGAEWGILPYLA